MRSGIVRRVLGLSAVLYGTIVWSYGAPLQASAHRSAALRQARTDDFRLMPESSRLEMLRAQLRRKLGHLILVAGPNDFDVLLQRMALVARKSHVTLIGLLPESGAATGRDKPLAGRGIAVRMRATFGGALAFLRLLPAVGVLLRVDSTALSRSGESRDPPSALEVTVHVRLIQ